MNNPILTPNDKASSAARFYAFEKARDDIMGSISKPLPQMINSNAGLSGSLGVASLKEAPTVFSDLFFSQENLDDTQNRIRYKIYLETKKVIPPQKESSIQLIQQRFYQELGQAPADPKNYKKAIDILNNLVRDQATWSILTEMTAFDRYRRDIKERVFLQNAQNVSSAGTRSLGSVDPRNALRL